MEIKCKFDELCSKRGTPRCSPICAAYTFMQGEYGNKGLWATRKVPFKYDGCRLSNLPKLSPDVTDKTVRLYAENILEKVSGGVGLFLASKPTTENRFGTGNGKTTTAATLVNEYTIARAHQHLRGENRLTDKANPALFVKSSEFQNMYNAQFRGTSDMQNEAAAKYYSFKEAMMKVELLVIDDIALRSGTDAFINEMYEIIDHRAVEELCTIYTSNIPLKELTSIYGDRIVSRIEGSTYSLYFDGKDHRKKL